ncbi:MAG: hypothetical protein KJ718_02460 [Nanoarchaeota archaeon]|nr:hypothetical protein [Nanoarchaeota archaeon]MBU1051393.1 hypothetical protein [Nanoarchaeota archaeon]MBU1988596.1 hypothetical protein [Nanoarchaeota archaeon]
MAFFDFLRRSSKKEEQKQLEEINLNEIPDWIGSKSNKIFENLDSEFEEIREKISQEKIALKQNLKNLEQAELKNKDIPDRMKQIMEGNRRIYVHKINSFIRKINFPSDTDEALNFAVSFDSELDKFDKSIGKSHNILEEFFPEKANLVSTNVKNIDKLVKEAKSKIKNSEVEKVNELKNHVSSTLNKIKQKEEGHKRLKLLEEDLKFHKETINNKESRLEQLQQQETYKKIIELMETKEQLEQKIKENESKFVHSFSEIETALKKYENLSENKLAKRYLEDSLNALLGDKDLEILGLLDAIKKAIASGDITLKDKKKDKVIKELDSLDKDYIESFLQTHTNSNKDLSELDSKIRSSNILKEIENLKDELKQDNTNLEKDKFKIGKMKKETEGIDVSQLISGLEDKIRENTGEEVKINN